MSESGVKWTNKGPALLVGIIILIFGALGLRKSLYLGAALMLLGAGFIGYSLTIKEWCAQTNPKSAFSSAFSTSFHGCLRQKGWLEF